MRHGTAGNTVHTTPHPHPMPGTPVGDPFCGCGETRPTYRAPLFLPRTGRHCRGAVVGRHRQPPGVDRDQPPRLPPGEGVRTAAQAARPNFDFPDRTKLIGPESATTSSLEACLWCAMRLIYQLHGYPTHLAWKARPSMVAALCATVPLDGRNVARFASGRGATSG